MPLNNKIGSYENLVGEQALKRTKKSLPAGKCAFFEKQREITAEKQFLHFPDFHQNSIRTIKVSIA